MKYPVPACDLERGDPQRQAARVVILLAVSTLMVPVLSSIWVGATYPRSCLLGPVLWKGQVHSLEVALTFDDGPDPRWTPSILRTLRHYDIPATFFLEGMNVSSYPKLAQEEKRDGEELGNHSWDHHDFRFLGPHSIGAELDRTQRAIRSATGETPTLFRPPYGNRNAFVWPEARSRGLEVVEWSLSPWHGPSPRPSDLVQQTLEHCRPGDIILLHDGRGNRRQTVEALPEIITRLRARGYRFVTVSQLARPLRA